MARLRVLPCHGPVMDTGGKPRPASDRTRWHRRDGPRLVEEVAAHILAAAGRACAGHGEFRLVLAGGTTPAAVYRRLAQADADWSCWRIYFGDERCLPAGDPGRNDVMAARNWLDHVGIPARNVYSIPAENGAAPAARAYATRVAAALPFDLVLLGMGEDGHTASLFPGHVHDPEALVHAEPDAPKPPPERVSLGPAALNAAREVLVLVTGRGKRDAVQCWRAGADLPVTHIHGLHGVDVYLDSAADPPGPAQAGSREVSV